jgi:hypothetical protein
VIDKISIVGSAHFNVQSFLVSRKSFFVARDVLKRKSARTEDLESLTCPRRQLPSERRLPLRQPPAELPFSAPSKPRTQSVLAGFSRILDP